MKWHCGHQSSLVNILHKQSQTFTTIVVANRNSKQVTAFLLLKLLPQAFNNVGCIQIPATENPPHKRDDLKRSIDNGLNRTIETNQVQLFTGLRKLTLNTWLLQWQPQLVGSPPRQLSYSRSSCLFIHDEWRILQMYGVYILDRTSRCTCFQSCYQLMLKQCNSMLSVDATAMQLLSYQLMLMQCNLCILGVVLTAECWLK